MTKASKIIPLAAVLLLVALAIPFQPAEVWGGGVGPSDVWVAPPPAGSDNNTGTTEEHPFATIQWGIDHVAPDGTVHVAAGTYYENLSIAYEQNLVGAGAQNTIIDGGGSGTVISISSDPDTPNTISGFTIQNGYTSGNTTASLWNPANEQVLFAGINLDSIKTLPRPFKPISQGGGIYIGSTHIVILNDCVIKDNEAEEGGGIYNCGQLYMNRCTVSGNSAVYGGGGIYNTPGWYTGSGKMWLTNCTISGNQLTEFGGSTGAGIANIYGTMELLNCTIAYNSTNLHGLDKAGGFYNFANDSIPDLHTAYFKNTIVANNTAGDDTSNNGESYPDGATVSLGYNLDSENSCGFDQPTDLVNTNPLLGPLQDNGGPTFTHALLHGSPAIDAGDNTGAPATDQRGAPRPQGTTYDIGAYELTQASVATATGTGTASFSTLNGYITDLTALDESELDCPPNGELAFPHGLFSFTISGITPGSPVTVAIILSSDMPTDTEYWKCINGQWVDCTSLLGSNDGDSVLTLTITDGGLGDRDGVANGEISDPGGAALEVEVVTAPAVVPLPPPAEPRVSPTPPRPLNPPQMSVQYVSVNPQQTIAGQPVTITTNVVNTGDEAGNLNIALKINGLVEQSRMVSVGPQGTQPVKFTITRAQPGTYTVDILGEQGSFTVLGAGGTTRAPVNGGLIALLIMGVLVLATVVILILTRKPA